MKRSAVLWAVATAIAVPLAGLGVALYAHDPDVDTYWLNTALVAPLVCIVIAGLHRVLPVRAQWVAAWILAPLGAVAYLVWPDEQWWNYGALGALPLVALAIEREDRIRDERGEEPDPWAGGMGDGPWGPP